MLRVLVVKTLSLGDVAYSIPDMVFDWVVEPNIFKIPGWHSLVVQAISVSTRRCTKYSSHAWLSGEQTQFKEQVCYFNTSFTGVVK